MQAQSRALPDLVPLEGPDISAINKLARFLMRGKLLRLINLPRLEYCLSEMLAGTHGVSEVKRGDRPRWP